MTAPVSAALLEALAFLRAPRSRRPGADQRLPEGVLQLIRIAAGEDEASEAAQAATHESPATLREAAIFYIQQVFFAPGSNSYRVLGVDPDASDERLREHYRWLARWLHPDRNPDEWEAVFAERVNNAWQDLRTSERRTRYQPVLEEVVEWSPVVTPPPPVHVFEQFEEPVAEPARKRDLRWLPSAVVAGLGAVAIALVVLFYSSQRPPIPETQVASVPSEPGELPRPAPPPERTPAPAPAVEAPTDVPAAAVMEPAAMPQPAPPAQPPVRPVAQPAAVAVVEPATPQRATEARKLVPVPPAPAPKPPKFAAAPSVKPTRTAPPPVAVAVVETSRPQARELVPAAALVPQAVEVATSAEPKPGSRDANRLLGQLSRAYEDGDVQGMRALFATDAQGPAGNLDSILADYRRVFSDSSARSLAMRDVSWFVSGETFTIVATFEASVTSGRAGRVRKTRGDLRLDLRRGGDRWQIFRMQHGDRPG
jgi:hypothetical protein